MAVDWNAFTPAAAVAGGLAIGAASLGMALLLGRVAGVSGIAGGLLRPQRGETGWRVVFLAGLLASPFAYAAVSTVPAVQVDASLGTLVVAGLLVGWGTRLGSGCTSGHGVCGMGRRSPRSLVAVIAFMATAFLVVYVTRHILA